MTHAAPTSDEDLQAQAQQHLPLVAALVRRFPPGVHAPEELYQQGCVGLMKALRRFRPEMGVTFSTYAVPVILGEMRLLARQGAVHIPRPEREMRLRIRREQERLVALLGREPTVDELSAALGIPPTELALLTEEVVITSTDAAPDESRPLHETLPAPDNWLTRVEVRDLLAGLPAIDRQLMTLRHLQGLTQAQTAAQLGLSQVQVSRREAVLRRQLRQMWYGI